MMGLGFCRTKKNGMTAHKVRFLSFPFAGPKLAAVAETYFSQTLQN